MIRKETERSDIRRQKSMKNERKRGRGRQGEKEER